MPSEPNWLPIEAVIEHNRLEVEATGERHFLRDRGLLESALARPRNFFGFGEEDLVVLAVVLMAGIAKATPLSKEISEQLSRPCDLFLVANRHDTTFDDDVSWADEIIALVEHRTTEQDFVSAVRPFVIER